MTTSEESPQVKLSALYQRANQINARLSSQSDPTLIAEGNEVADALLGEIRQAVDDFDAFVARVDRAAEFSLHDSARMPKTESNLRVYYERATTLLETIEKTKPRR
jgi:hypothetical protein